MAIVEKNPKTSAPPCSRTHLIGRDQLLRLEHRAPAARAGVLAGHGLRRLVVGHELGPANQMNRYCTGMLKNGET